MLSSKSNFASEDFFFKIQVRDEDRTVADRACRVDVEEFLNLNIEEESLSRERYGVGHCHAARTFPGVKLKGVVRTLGGLPHYHFQQRKKNKVANVRRNI